MVLIRKIIQILLRASLNCSVLLLPQRLSGKQAACRCVKSHQPVLWAPPLDDPLPWDQQSCWTPGSTAQAPLQWYPQSSPESCSSGLNGPIHAQPGEHSTSPRVPYKVLNPKYWSFLSLVLAWSPSGGPQGCLWILSGPRVINSPPSFPLWSFVELRHSTDCHSLILTSANLKNWQELKLKAMLIFWTNIHKIRHYVFFSMCFLSMLKLLSMALTYIECNI